MTERGHIRTTRNAPQTVVFFFPPKFTMRLPIWPPNARACVLIPARRHPGVVWFAWPNRARSLTLKIGDILHMSMTPAPSNWPSELWNVNSGTPTSSDNTRNCRIKLAASREQKKKKKKEINNEYIYNLDKRVRLFVKLKLISLRIHTGTSLYNVILSVIILYQFVYHSIIIIFCIIYNTCSSFQGLRIATPEARRA